MEIPKFLTNDHITDIRRNADWRATWRALGIEVDERRSKPDDWWACSPLSGENTPSLHMNDRGFYCHSTGTGAAIKKPEAMPRP